MKALIFKEIRGYLSTLTGYLVVAVFLLLCGLFLWVIDGSFNILDAGYSSLESFFVIAPWVFMFLIPAVTMRMFADEHKAGTLELLLTRPLTELQIIGAKFIAACLLVVLALIPTLVFWYSVHALGDPVGNIDVGATLGSYIGLFLVGACYVGLGIMASALTKNQVVAFILGMFFCFFFYKGISSLASFEALGALEYYVQLWSLDTHYSSISRGVVDSRDLIFMFSFMAASLFITQTVIRARKW